MPVAEQGGALPPRFDPFALLQQGDPYDSYASLRKAGALLRVTPGIWMLPRYDEVSAALSDTRLESFRFQQNGHLINTGAGRQNAPSYASARSFLDGAVVAAAGPDHARIRAVLRQALTKRLTSALQERIDADAEQILDASLERGSLEAVSELAHILPVKVIADVLGIHTEDLAGLSRTVLTLSALFSPFISDVDRQAADDAVIQLRQFISRIFGERLNHPQDDLLSDLVLASAHGAMTAMEAVDNAIFLLFAGLETSVTMIASGCAALASFPGEMDRLRACPQLAATAVEEFLRFDSPTQITARRAAHTIQIAGRSLQSGRVVLLMLGSANRDERHFHNSSLLDIGRSPNRHLAFGAGAHYCIGAALARMEGAAVFRSIAKKFSKFELRSEPVRSASVTPRVYLKVDVFVA